MANYAYFNGTGVTDMFLYGNSITGGLFGKYILVGIYLVVFLTLKSFYSSEKCFMTAGYITVVLAGMLLALDIIEQQAFLIASALCLASALYYFIVGE